ncbi:MAG: MFS transporter [Candidatus Heimdallarchaeota archaeon]
MALFNYSRLRVSEYAGIASVQFLLFFRRLIIYTFLAIYLRVVIGLSTTETSLLSAIGMIVSSIAQPFLWGRLLDRWKISGSMFVAIGEIIAGLGHIFMFLWHKATLETGNIRLAGFVIIISLGFIELPWSMSNVGWSTLISEKTEEEERTKLMGQLSVVGGIGGIIGAYLGGQLYIGGLGFSSGVLFFVAAIVMFGSGIIVFFSVKRGESLKHDRNYSGTMITTITSLSELPSNVTKTFVILLGSLAFFFFGLNSVVFTAIFYIVDPNAFNASDQQVALYRNVWSIFQIIGGIFLGIVSYRIKDTKILLFGIVIGSLALFWLPFAPNYNIALVTPGLYGLSFVLGRSASYSVVAKIIPPDFRGRLFGYYNSVFFLSWGLGGTVLGGPVADYFISRGYSAAEAYRVSFFAAGGLVIFGLIMMLYAIKLIGSLEIATEKRS